MTNLECLLFALDLDGGTIHQMQDITGVNALTLLHGKPETTFLDSDFRSGDFAVSTCSVEFNKSVNFPKHKGHLMMHKNPLESTPTMHQLLEP